MLDIKFLVQIDWILFFYFFPHLLVNLSHFHFLF